ncbi:MAG: roadblock/LC7 domain-containing protein [Candidatus Njordarchaeia archaeon]|nr:roadblock/LC7 domain-containing protein [Candidatus Korarchaeota archaeon]
MEEPTPDEILAALTGGIEVSEVSSEISQILEKLISINESIEGAIVSSAEGLPLSWISKESEMMREEGKLAAAVTVIFSTSERNSLDLGKGHIDHVIIKAERGYIILGLVGEDHILALVTSTAAKLGIVLRDLRWASEKIGEIFDKYRS